MPGFPGAGSERTRSEPEAPRLELCCEGGFSLLLSPTVTLLCVMHQLLTAAAAALGLGLGTWELLGNTCCMKNNDKGDSSEPFWQEDNRAHRPRRRLDAPCGYYEQGCRLAKRGRDPMVVHNSSKLFKEPSQAASPCSRLCLHVVDLGDGQAGEVRQRREEDDTVCLEQGALGPLELSYRRVRSGRPRYPQLAPNAAGELPPVVSTPQTPGLP